MTCLSSSPEFRTESPRPRCAYGVQEEWLVGLTSLLTGMLYRASPDGCISKSDPAALPRNFVSVATLALRALTNAAMLDVKAMQVAPCRCLRL